MILIASQIKFMKKSSRGLTAKRRALYKVPIGYANCFTAYFQIIQSYRLPHTKRVKDNIEISEKGFAKTVSRALCLQQLFWRLVLAFMKLPHSCLKGTLITIIHFFDKDY